jgi:hypothetical protein
VRWLIEPIPDEDLLYRRVHVNLFPAVNGYGDIPPGAFRDNDGISTDWSRYSTAAECKNRAIEHEKNAVVQFRACDVRAFKSLSVIHEPEENNRSHSSIRGLRDSRREDQTDIRKRLARTSSLIIHVRL